MFPLICIFVGLAICVGAVLYWRKSSSDEAAHDAPVENSSYTYIHPNDAPATAVKQRVSGEIPPWESVRQSNVKPETGATIAAGVYQSLLFETDPGAFRQQMEAALTKCGAPLPTKSQWEMILSPERAARVIAGAGSGKSTALSLRVVLLHKFLGHPLNQITVVTFTRASRADMVKKLIRDMQIFGISLSEEAARRVVRTFHSMIIEQASGVGAQITFFEQMGDKTESGGDSDNLGALNTKQLIYLRQLYASLYRSNKKFNKAIGQVLLEKITAPRQILYTDSEGLDRAIMVAEPRDRVVTQAMTDAWLAKPGFDSKPEVIEWGATAIKTSRSGGVWYANGRVITTGMPVILGCGGIKEATKKTLDRGKYPIGEMDKDRTLGFIGNVRLKIIATIAIEKYLYIETDEDLSDLYTLIDWVYRGRLPGDRDTFPAFTLRIPGESSSASIFECLYNTGTFIASMGMDVASAAEIIAGEMSIDGLHLESYLCRALAEYWPALHQSGNSTYDELFLRHGNIEYTATLPQQTLLPMKNLLMDEFQDISGHIVEWVKAVHSVLAKQGEEPSLLAVGDDWQSVYGWRGSDPEYMIRFEEHFGESKLVVMNENFRCGQLIINMAEKMVQTLAGCDFQKHGVACGQAAKALGEVELCNGGDEQINKLVTELKANDPTQKIFILSRTNEGLVPFRKFSSDKQVSLLTMHRAKGLEADIVIIKGDCSYSNISSLRNAIYALAGMYATYDSAQQDESLRLAYVSITRARKKVYWFGDNAKPGGAFSVLLGAEEEGQQQGSERRASR